MQENLLLDENSNIKLIDFGLSAEPQVCECNVLLLAYSEQIVAILQRWCQHFLHAHAAHTHQ